MANVYDTSFQRPAPSALDPGDGVILYVSHDPSNTKIPSPAECVAYRKANHSVGFVYEWYAERAAEGVMGPDRRTGYDAGYADGLAAVGQAIDRGHHLGKPIYVAHDTGLPVSVDYLRGWEDSAGAHFLPGLYAGDRNLEIARDRGWHYLWQASAKSWSNHWDDTHNHGAYVYATLVQELSTTIPGTDRNIIIDENWNRPVPIVLTPSTKGEDEMVLWYNDTNSGASCFWLTGGKALPSLEQKSRQSFIKNGGLVIHAEDTEYKRVLAFYSPAA